MGNAAQSLQVDSATPHVVVVECGEREGIRGGDKEKERVL